MKNQYMDFVPTGATKSAKRKTVAKTATRGSGAAKPAAKAVARPKAPNRAARGAAAKTAVKAPARAAKAVRTPAKVAQVKKAPARVAKVPAGAKAKVVATAAESAAVTEAVSFTTEKKPKLGMVENLNTRFVRSDVPKRPLSRGAHFTTAKTGVAAAKARKVGNQAPAMAKPVENSVEKPKTTGVYQAPNNPFIYQSNTAKRPLSKNVYQKKVITPMEEPQGPVTIISQPDKQAHVGMIVTIILTIILGAAAGTVAFLLLPK